MSHGLDYFIIFGLDTEYVKENVDKKYRMLSLDLHPDKCIRQSNDAENEIKIFIYSVSPTEKELSLVENNHRIIFEFNQKYRLWFLHACTVEPDISKKPLRRFQQSENPEKVNLAIEIDKCKPRVEVHGDLYKKLKSFAGTRNRKSLVEAQSERFLSLNNARNRFLDSKIRDIYKTAHTMIVKLSEELNSRAMSSESIQKISIIEEIIRVIRSEVSKYLDEKLIAYYENQKIRASYINDFIRGWIKLIGEFGYYMLFINRDIYENCVPEKIILDIQEVTQLVYETFSNYIDYGIKIESFDQGSFILTVFLNSMVNNIMNITRFMRLNMGSYKINTALQLNKLQMDLIHYAMSNPKALLSINTSLFCLALLELPIQDDYFIQILKSILEPNHYEAIAFFLKDKVDSKSMDLCPIENLEKMDAEQIKKWKRDHNHLLKSVNISKNFSIEEKKQFLLDGKVFNKIIGTDLNNQKKIHDIFMRSYSEEKTLILDYLFYEQKKMLLLLANAYQTIIDYPNIINIHNVQSIKERFAALKSRTSALLKGITLFLLKKYIIPACEQHRDILEKNSRPYLENLLWNQFNESNIEIEKLQSSIPCINADTEFRSLSKSIYTFLIVMRPIGKLDLNSLENVSGLLHMNGVIKALPFSNEELRALEMLRQINSTFAVDELSRVPAHADIYALEVESTSDALNKYLDCFADESLNNPIYTNNTIVLNNEVAKFKMMQDKALDLINKYRFIFKRTNRYKLKSTKINILMDWKNECQDILQAYNEIETEMYFSPYVNTLVDICGLSSQHKDLIHIQWKNCCSGKENASINNLLHLLENNMKAMEVKQAVSTSKHYKCVSEKYDYHSMSLVKIKSLAECLLLVEKLKALELGMLKYKIEENIDGIIQSYHKDQYNEYLAGYRKWIAYGINTYKSLQKSLIDINECEDSVRLNLLNINEKNLNINFDSNVINIEKQIQIFKNNKKYINKLEQNTNKLLTFLENAFFELNYLQLDISSLTKQFTSKEKNTMNFADCVKAKHEKLNMLAANANVEVDKTETAELPTEENLRAIEKQLSMILLKTREYSNNIMKIKGNVMAKHDELLKMKEIFKKENIEKQTLKEEFGKQYSEFSRLQNYFMRLFDSSYTDGAHSVMPGLLENLKKIRNELRSLPSSSFIVIFKEKIQKINFLRNRLYELGETVQDDSFIAAEETLFCDTKLEQWLKKSRLYLEKTIHSLLEDSYNLFDQLIKINIETVDRDPKLFEQLQGFSNSSNEILLQYHSILEFVCLYKEFGVNLVFEESELWSLYKTLNVNTKAIESIIDVFAQEEKHAVKANSANTPDKETLTQQSTKKNLSPARQRKKAKRKNNHTLLSTYRDQFEAFAQEIAIYSRKILSLKLEADRSKNTIDTLLPNVPLDRGREGLRHILKRKISSLGNQIRSYATMITELRNKGAGLVQESLARLKPLLSEALVKEIQEISCIILSNDCRVLSLVEEDKANYKITIDTVSGERIFKLEMNSLPTRSDIEFLSLAIKGLNSLLDGNWYINQTGFIISKIEKFLCLMAATNSSQSVIYTENPYYKEFFDRIIKTIEQAKQKIDYFNASRYAAAFLEQKTEQINDLQNLLIDLETKITFLINSFKEEPSLNQDLETNKVFEIRAMLSDLITGGAQSLQSIVPPVTPAHTMYQYVDPFMYNPNPLAVVPYAQSSCRFFVPAPITSPPVCVQAPLLAPVLVYS